MHRIIRDGASNYRQSHQWRRWDDRHAVSPL